MEYVKIECKKIDNQVCWKKNTSCWNKLQALMFALHYLTMVL